MELIKEEFDSLISNLIGLKYFIHCGYDKIGVQFGSDTISMHESIPFSFEDDFEDADNDEYFPYAEEKKPEMPTFLTSKVNLTFAKALTAILYAYKPYRDIIDQSENVCMIDLRRIFENKSEQKTITVNRIFIDNSASIWTLKQYIDYVNICTNNIITYINRDKGKEEERTSIIVSNTRKM